MTKPASELAWKLADFRRADADPPIECVNNPGLTQGELMTAPQVEAFIKDSIATIRILEDKHSKHLERVVETYRADLAYLVSVGSLSQDDYNDLTHPDNLRFT
jgi:hypothetical protein